MDDDLHRALLELTGFLNRPQADAALLRRAGSHLDRALFPLLIRAGADEDATVGRLADAVGRHHTTVSRQVAALEQLGMLRRTASAADGRSSSLRVTAKGRREIGRITAARQEAMGEVFAGWTATEQRELTRLVRKLVASMEGAVDRDAVVRRSSPLAASAGPRAVTHLRPPSPVQQRKDQP